MLVVSGIMLSFTILFCVFGASQDTNSKTQVNAINRQTKELKAIARELATLNRTLAKWRDK